MAGMLGNALQWAAIQLHRLRLQQQFRRHMGFYGDFAQPRSHQEKLQFRKIYGNHRFYALVADKFRVRGYVAARVGGKYLVPLLAACDHLEPRDFDGLPGRFIIKANHASRWNQVVRDKGMLDVDAAVRRFNRYTRMRYGWASGERHYNFIKPKILIEELLESNTGGAPWDYRFFCYNSPSGFDYAYSIVAPDSRAAVFARDGELLVSAIAARELAPHLRPSNFGKMLQVARALSADFDFVRVDLHSVGDRIYFGGLACSPQHSYGDARQQGMLD